MNRSSATVTVPSPLAAIAARRRAVIASSIGNALEWFDFLLYAFFARAIAAAFFPTGSPTVSLLLTLATFAIGFVVRPLGGVLLGLYADRAGRRRALSLLILLMAAGTLGLGLIPGYATIGLAAPLLMVLARLLQGFSVGGEFGSATAMLVEFAPPGRRFLFGSLQMVAQALALLLASLAALTVHAALGPAATMAWGWRLPFLLGALIAPVGFYLRRRVDESPEFLEALDDAGCERQPLAIALRQAGRAVLTAIGVTIAGTAGLYVWLVYLPLFVVQRLHLPATTALAATVPCTLLLLLIYPVAGWLADRVGGWRIFFPALIGTAVLNWVLFAQVIAAPGWYRLVAAELAATLPLGFLGGPAPALLATLFPVRIRSTGLALGYNLAVILFGGLAPLLVTALIHATGDNAVPAYYVIACCTLSLALVAGTVPRRPG